MQLPYQETVCGLLKARLKRVSLIQMNHPGIFVYSWWWWCMWVPPFMIMTWASPTHQLWI